MHPPPATHRIVDVGDWRVPRPFRSFAVRSEEARHAAVARSPYGRVHVLRVAGLQARDLAALAADGHGRMDLPAFGDIAYARTTLVELQAAAPQAGDLALQLSQALARTGVLGDDPSDYRRSFDTRIDYLGARGAGFHNDVARHWSACLFWLLALDADDVEFVMPHAALRVPVAAGDLLVFDQTLAHGLCRPRDGGQALAASFETGGPDRQIFLTGELPLSDAQWAALDAPWLPVAEHAARGALDLMVASFDERSGAIQRLQALRDGMHAGTCHAEDAQVDDAMP